MPAIKLMPLLHYQPECLNPAGAIPGKYICRVCQQLINVTAASYNVAGNIWQIPTQDYVTNDPIGYLYCPPPFTACAFATIGGESSDVDCS